MSENPQVNVETIEIKPSRFNRIVNRSKDLMSDLGTGSMKAVRATEAAVLTVVEPVVIVVKEAGKEYCEKFETLEERSLKASVRRDLKRTKRAQARLEAARKLVIATEAAAQEATQAPVAAGPAPKHTPPARRTKPTLVTE